MNRPAKTLAAVLLAAATIASAQPDQPRPGVPEGNASRETIRERLERRLEQARAIVQRLEAAIEALDAGKMPELDEPPRRGQSRDRGPERRPAPDRDEILAFVAEHLPELAESMRALRDERPGAADNILRRIGPRVAEVLRTREPELRTLRTREFVARYRIFETERAARKAFRAGDEETAAAHDADLRDLLGEQHDIQRAMTEYEINAIETRLAALRDELKQSDSDRDEFIERALNRIKTGRDPR